MSARRRPGARQRAARREGRSQRVLAALIFVVATNFVIVLTATNSVPASRAGNIVGDITANDLKPSACDALDLTNVEGGTLIITGTSANDLLLGSELSDTLRGHEGSDCLVGGPGADTLDGGAGTDICLGGGGVDMFVGCESEIAT